MTLAHALFFGDEWHKPSLTDQGENNYIMNENTKWGMKLLNDEWEFTNNYMKWDLVQYIDSV